MKFTMPKTPLVAALSRCAAIAGVRPTMPILANVLLEPCVGVLKVSATDLETGYTTAVDNLAWLDGLDQIEEPIHIAVPAKKLLECVKAIPVSYVDIEYNAPDRRVIISGGTVSFTLACDESEMFPPLPQVEGNQFDLDAPALVKILESVAYAQSKDDTKYNLCGCLIKIEDNVDGELFLTAVATDGHRLALDNVCLPGDPRLVPKDLAKGVIISTKGVAEICKIKTPGVIVISIAGNNLCIATDNEKLYLRMIDGDYPNYSLVIPSDTDKCLEVKRQSLIDALERCRIMSDKESRGVSIITVDGAVVIWAELVNIGGHAEDRVTASVPVEPLSPRVNRIPAPEPQQHGLWSD